MNLTARISFKDPDGCASSFNLRALQTLVIGASMAADVQVYDAANVLEKHCQVAISHEGCFLRDMSGGRGAATRLNGVVVTEEAELAEKNELEIGSNEILIEVFGLEELRNELQQVARERQDTAGVKPLFDVPDIQTLENGLRFFEFPHIDEMPQIFKDEIAGERRFFYMENHKSCDLELQDPEDDLLSEFPDNIRRKNSLTLTGPIQFEELSNQFFANFERDHAILAAPQKADSSLDEFRTAVQPLAAWFLKPSSFNFHMRNGIEFLLEKTFNDLAFVAYYLPDEKSWVIATTNSEMREFCNLLQIEHEKAI